MTKRPMLGEVLMAMGLLDEHQLQSALAHQDQWGGSLGHALVELKRITPRQLLQALSRQTGLPSIDLDSTPIDPSLTSVFPLKIAELHHAVPLRLEGQRQEVLVVALAAPAGLEVQDQIRNVARKQRVLPYVAEDGAIARAISRLYNVPLRTEREDVQPLSQAFVANEVELNLESEAEPAPSPAPSSQVLIFGWPDAAALKIGRLLGNASINARTAQAPDVLSAGPDDIVFVPLPTIEAMIAQGQRPRCKMLVAGKTPDTDFERAQRVGAKGFVTAPVDDELLLRAVRRLQKP